MDSREVFSLILVAAGLTALGYSIWLRFRVRQSRSWPTAPGQVVYSEKAYETLRHGPHRTAGGRITKADVRYRFAVGGEEYTGNTVCIGREIYTSFDARADRVLTRYPLGADVTVYYNPENPADCCLEQRSEATGILTGAGVGALVLSFFF